MSLMLTIPDKIGGKLSPSHRSKSAGFDSPVKKESV